MKIFDWYLTELNSQWAKNDTLTKDQVKALGEQARFIVKSFKYIEKPSTKSVKLGFYITKLAEATGFDSRRQHEIIYQGQILEWE